jgi:cytochrome c oxidase assembly protein subunit 15
MVAVDSAKDDETDDIHGVWSAWPYRLALITTAATFILILAGGIVTTTGTGMAVPDWPSTFGHNMFLYPWSKMIGGIFYEHTHRLIGSLVGSLTLTLAILLWALEPRRWVCALGVVALAAVTMQGVLGGLRVILAQDALAIVHGGFAHAFFALVAALALFTSPGWRTPPSILASAPDAFRLRRLALYTTVGLYVQVLLGTLVTHLGVRLDAHLSVAALVSAAVVLLGFRIARARADWPELVRPTEVLHGLWALQMLLGLGAYVAKFHAEDIALGAATALVLAVSHRLAGGLMLITSLMVTLRVYRRTGWPDSLGDSEPFRRRMAA